MAELVTSPRYRAYLDHLISELDRAMEIAQAAKAKGFDPRTEVEIPVASDLAGRVEALLNYKGVAARIRELEERMSREEASLKIGDAFVSREFGETTREEILDHAIRASVALLTEGVVAAPTEGIGKIGIKKNDDGSEYLVIYYAGPIRSAGGTAQALSVLVGDYVRRLLNLDRYKPRAEEIERYVEELKQYNGIQSMQYLPKDDDIRLIIRNCPVCINGEPTENEEISGYRNLERVETNVVRGGMCLVIAEGIGLKAPKIQKNVAKMHLDGWEWLETLISGTASISPDEEEEPGIHPKDKYLRDMLAGRPPFSYPMRKGGFRLRLGRCRNTGFATCGFNPATLHVLDDYLAIGTQMKVERPGKACGVAPCDSIEGPTVRLTSGEVRRIDTLAEADRHVDANEIAYILDVGEILISYGEFLENNHVLAPPSYCEEWWLQEGGPRHPESEAEAISFVAEGAYLHPNYTWFWDDCTGDQIKNLSDKVSATGLVRDGVLYIPADSEVKSILEELLVPHTVEDYHYVIRMPLALIAGLGLSYTLEKNAAWNTLPPFTNGLVMAEHLSGIKMRSKAGTRIGGRMGRPGKSAPRKMKPPVHVLFPIGEAGGLRRSIDNAAKFCDTDVSNQTFSGTAVTTGQIEGLIHVEAGERKCPHCRVVTFKSRCPHCGSHTEAVYRCPRCSTAGQPNGELCPRCGSPLVCRKENLMSLRQEYIAALAVTCLSASDIPELKGVRGLSSRERVVEPLEKGILRAANGVYVFRDGTVRYDMIDLPLTHFRPAEISVSIEKLRIIGYTKDRHGRELVSSDQLVELLPQDILVSEDCGEYLVRVAKYIDQLLERLYNLGPFYRAEAPEDLVGQLVMGLAPHTSAGVLARLIGFTKAKAGYAHPFYHAAKRRNCDGDEDCVMLLMDGLVNFSRSFLPSTRGGTMDAPLVLTTTLNPKEVDKETLNVDVMSRYPLAIYLACLTYTPPKTLENIVDHVESRLGTPAQFEGFSFSHDTRDISDGPLDTMYTNPMLKGTTEKIKAELALADRIRAVETDDLVERIINSHLMPDLIGNLRAFSRQSFRCPRCKRSFRRIPISGKCTKCGAVLKATMHKGNVTKYLEIAKYMSEHYKLSEYTNQRIAVMEMNIWSTFGQKEKQQMDLSDFF
ncbi:MAG: DNA polymerase II large subunit [Methanocalculaceae archaeon]|jgi:DNA polymerase II large subunit|nr:DNA polymerase II large subunit [Methanocalculaceae archaeon]